MGIPNSCKWLSHSQIDTCAHTQRWMGLKGYKMSLDPDFTSPALKSCFRHCSEEFKGSRLSRVPSKEAGTTSPPSKVLGEAVQQHWSDKFWLVVVHKMKQ